MRILIFTLPGDVHGLAVTAALAELGHEVYLTAGPDYSDELCSSVHFDEASATWTLRGRTFSLDYFDVVWLRRRQYPASPSALHSDDHEFAAAEIEAFYSGLWAATAQRAHWLHRPGSADAGENKMLQLALARSVGLTIPESLFSNDQSAILAFAQRVEDGGGRLLYKTFCSSSWRAGENMKVCYAAVVSSAQLAGRSLLAAVPGIYQRYTEKAFEIRINIFGPTTSCVAIDSQRDECGKSDWRNLLNLEGYLQSIEIPAHIENKCRALMKLLDIEIACFDFIVDRNGSFVFLELNQQGQFLWIEEALPSEHLLQNMVICLLHNGKLGDIPTLRKETNAIDLDSIRRSPRFEQLSREFDANRGAHAVPDTVFPNTPQVEDAAHEIATT